MWKFVCGIQYLVRWKFWSNEYALDLDGELEEEKESRELWWGWKWIKLSRISNKNKKIKNKREPLQRKHAHKEYNHSPWILLSRQGNKICENEAVKCGRLKNVEFYETF